MVTYDVNANMVSTGEEPINPTWSNCTYCMQEESLCDCVSMSDGSIGDPYLQSVLLESIVRPESLTGRTVQDSNIVKMDDKKSSAFVSGEGLNESFTEDYCQLLASMFHAATSIGQVHLWSMCHPIDTPNLYQIIVRNLSV